jgi:D-tyrosyl-tRNA(Tyr) deacylase
VRAVAQCVSRASIDVEGEAVGAMGPGLLALVGVAREDAPDDARQLADKLVHLRVFPDPEGKMNLCLLDIGGTLGVVSQFTLLGNCRKGRRPSYADAAPPEQAERLIELLIAEAGKLGVSVTTGRFRARMRVELVNEGPVTLVLDTGALF